MTQDKIDFQKMTEHLKVGVFRYTPGTNGKFVYSNATFRKMLGYEAEDITDLDVNDIFADVRSFAALSIGLSCQHKDCWSTLKQLLDIPVAQSLVVEHKMG